MNLHAQKNPYPCVRNGIEQWILYDTDLVLMRSGYRGKNEVGMGQLLIAGYRYVSRRWTAHCREGGSHYS
ncbi:MAG: hypothetical protein ACLP5H_08890 [Desulfomonilaceae bacterium]